MKRWETRRRGGNLLRILVVEDEPKMALALRRGLEQEGYSVESAIDGDEGLASSFLDTLNII
jgi:DNA-binding response OmpR family regulator